MTTTTTGEHSSGGAELVPVAEPLFTDGERMALAGFLTGYSGLTRDAYTLDLRQYTSWCAQHGVHLITAKRADVERFGRDMEADGRARATIARRLCPVARFYRYAVEEDLLDHSPAAHDSRPRLDYESLAVGLDRNEVGRCWSLPGLALPPNTHSSHGWRSTGCGSPKPSAPTSTNSDSNAATAP